MSGVKIRNLSKRYGARKVLDGLNADVAENEIVAIIGASGSGKTTLLLCILGFVEPDAGNIEVDGRDIGELAIQDRHLAYMPQDYGLFPHLNVGRNVAFALAVRHADERTREKRLQELLKAVGLPMSFSARDVGTLSGGEKQRVALARSLALEPKLFLLDEPLSAIDPEMKQKVGAQLRVLIKRLGIPSIVIVHDPDEAKLLADSVWRLESGKLKKISFEGE